MTMYPTHELDHDQSIDARSTLYFSTPDAAPMATTYIDLARGLSGAAGPSSYTATHADHWHADHDHAPASGAHYAVDVVEDVCTGGSGDFAVDSQDPSTLDVESSYIPSTTVVAQAPLAAGFGSAGYATFYGNGVPLFEPQAVDFDGHAFHEVNGTWGDDTSTSQASHHDTQDEHASYYPSGESTSLQYYDPYAFPQVQDAFFFEPLAEDNSERPISPLELYTAVLNEWEVPDRILSQDPQLYAGHDAQNLGSEDVTGTPWSDAATAAGPSVPFRFAHENIYQSGPAGSLPKTLSSSITAEYYRTPESERQGSLEFESALAHTNEWDELPSIIELTAGTENPTLDNISESQPPMTRGVSGYSSSMSAPQHLSSVSVTHHNGSFNTLSAILPQYSMPDPPFAEGGDTDPSHVGTTSQLGTYAHSPELPKPQFIVGSSSSTQMRQPGPSSLPGPVHTSQVASTKESAKRDKGKRRWARKDEEGEEPAIPPPPVPADTWIMFDDTGSVTYYNPLFKGAQPLAKQTKKLKLYFTVPRPNRSPSHYCRYIDPTDCKDDPVEECGKHSSDCYNWQRHITTVHAKNERQDIEDGKLTLERAVALKYPALLEVLPEYVCYLDTCRYYLETGKRWTLKKERDDRERRAHEVEYHPEPRQPKRRKRAGTDAAKPGPVKKSKLKDS
ncbi:hypothetical protein K439DRAFT_568938 [Ramaria rubella]|nr:hypothetical protein K439DRAFT_568938 [Ramaria rubella]